MPIKVTSHRAHALAAAKLQGARRYCFRSGPVPVGSNRRRSAYPAARWLIMRGVPARRAMPGNGGVVTVQNYPSNPRRGRMRETGCGRTRGNIA